MGHPIANLGRGFPIRPHLARPIVSSGAAPAPVVSRAYIVSAVNSTAAQLFTRRIKPHLPKRQSYPNPGVPTVVTITDLATTTWTVPAGVTMLTLVELYGGGGGGGAGDLGGILFGGSGGGGGAYCASVNIPVTPGQVLSIRIGPGGAGASTPSIGGSAGTDSNCYDFSMVAGAGGGGAAAGGAGGTGGAASGGNSANTSGSTGAVGTNPAGGAGGNAAAPAGGAGGAGGPSAGQPGSAGSVPGGGGGGGGKSSGLGGNGAKGSISFTYNAPFIAIVPKTVIISAANANAGIYRRRYHNRLAPAIVAPPATPKLTSTPFIVSAVKAAVPLYFRRTKPHLARPVIPLATLANWVFLRNIDVTIPGLASPDVTIPGMSSLGVTAPSLSSVEVLTEYDQI